LIAANPMEKLRARKGEKNPLPIGMPPKAIPVAPEKIAAYASNGYGLYDMAGNVCNRCWDWYGAYSSDSQTDPHGPSAGSLRVMRGGSWYNHADISRCANRYPYNPAFDYFDVGFRCVRGH